MKQLMATEIFLHESSFINILQGPKYASETRSNLNVALIQAEKNKIEEGNTFSKLTWFFKFTLKKYKKLHIYFCVIYFTMIWNRIIFLSLYPFSHRHCFTAHYYSHMDLPKSYFLKRNDLPKIICRRAIIQLLPTIFNNFQKNVQSTTSGFFNKVPGVTHVSQ